MTTRAPAYDGRERLTCARCDEQFDRPGGLRGTKPKRCRKCSREFDRARKRMAARKEKTL